MTFLQNTESKNKQKNNLFQRIKWFKERECEVIVMRKTQDQDPLPVIGIITEMDVVSDHQNILVSQAKQGKSTKDLVIHLEDIIQYKNLFNE